MEKEIFRACGKYGCVGTVVKYDNDEMEITQILRDKHGKEQGYHKITLTDVEISELYEFIRDYIVKGKTI